MTDQKSPLVNLRVANPCPAIWNEMRGDDRVRFCGECKLNVYNISGMSTFDAEELLRKSEGRLCVRYYQRTDGRIMTADCPRGLVAARLKLARVVAITAGMVISGFGYAIQHEKRNSGEQTWIDKGREIPIVQKLIDKICPSASRGNWIAGDVAMPGPPAKP